MSNEYNEAILEQLFEEGLDLFNGDEDRAASYARTRFEQLPEPDIKAIGMQDGGGVFGAFDAPPASQEMFAKLQDRTNVFDDPMGSKALGSINRAIVGAPIDALDAAGRVGETILRGAAKGAEGIMSALGSDETMAKRMGRDVYGLGLAASTLAPAAPRVMSSRSVKGDGAPNPSGNASAGALMAADDFSKAKGRAKKEAALENYESRALEDAFVDQVKYMDDLAESSPTKNVPTPDGFLDALQTNYVAERYNINAEGQPMYFGQGMSRAEAFAKALRDTERQMDFDLMGGEANMIQRLERDYGFSGLEKALRSYDATQRGD